jgi:hypothetical protein
MLTTYDKKDSWTLINLVSVSNVLLVVLFKMRLVVEEDMDCILVYITKISKINLMNKKYAKPFYFFCYGPNFLFKQ